MLSRYQLRLAIFFVLLFSLVGCRSNAERSRALLNEANKLGDQEIKLMEQWARQFGQVFSEQNRAQFPSNRDWLASEGQKVASRIDESLRLLNEAAEKYDAAGRLMDNPQDRKGLSYIASSIRKEAEIKELLKAQAQLASDKTINDAQTFNDKFAQLTALIHQRQKEKDQQFDEGKRLLRGR